MALIGYKFTFSRNQEIFDRIIPWQCFLILNPIEVLPFFRQEKGLYLLSPAWVLARMNLGFTRAFLA
jgi:hypothetical protein